MSDPGERLQKVLAHAGVGSRRAVEDLISGGRVRVNGDRARLGQRVDKAKDKVEVDGSRVPLDGRLVHYLLNKPLGTVTTASDPQGRSTVVDLVGGERRVWPVGRLDADSEGALLLTNDGELTQRLTHPSHDVPKTYVAEVSGRVTTSTARSLARGVVLDGTVTKPAHVRVLGGGRGGTLVEIAVAEGRNRQVRRMLEDAGHPVTRLVRVAIGPVALGRLKPGRFRRLAPGEVSALYRACGL